MIGKTRLGVLIILIIAMAANHLVQAEEADPAQHSAVQDDKAQQDKAQDNERPRELCSFDLPIPSRPNIDDPLSLDEIYLRADTSTLVEKGLSILQGNVEMARNNQQITTLQVQYDNLKKHLLSDDEVYYWEEDFFLHSDDADLQLEQEIYTFRNAYYIFIKDRAQGHAKTLTAYSNTRTRLDKASYTTCELTRPFWQLSAQKVWLNHETEWGRAHHALLKIKGIPVFYSPYLNFPISDARKTGLLTPSYGSSTRNGREFIIPFYWNIAPHMDATLSTRFFSDNGLMWIGEYRYLFTSGHGQINLEYLQDDKKFDGEDRSLFTMEHRQSVLDNKGQLSITYSHASDQHYLEDFENSLSQTSASFLERLAEFTYHDQLGEYGSWNMLLRLQDYQDVDANLSSDSRPYQRVPQIQLNFSSPGENQQLNYGVKTDISYFYRNNDLASEEDVIGLRTDLYPYLSYPINRPAGYFIPKIGLHYTQYNLDNTGISADNPSRLAPLFSIDSGIFLDRQLTLFGKPYQQTLEPRLYYLYIPEQEQDDLPAFDSNLNDFSINSLFLENRFNGGDRIGDSNRFSLLVSSSLNDQTGHTLGNAYVGQIYYLSDRNVTLPGGTPLTERVSPIAMGIDTTPYKGWSMSSTWQWEPLEKTTRALTFGIHYNMPSAKILNLSYRARSEGDSQIDLSFHWPLGRNWNIMGRWNHSLPEQRILETFVGIEYNDCCWSIRMVARRFTETADSFNTGLFLQIELKGLTSLGAGRSVTDFLQQNIPNYRSEY